MVASYTTTAYPGPIGAPDRKNCKYGSDSIRPYCRDPSRIATSCEHWKGARAAVMSFDFETLTPSKLKPLVVDLDGTLVRSVLLVESAFAHLGHDPLRVVGLLSAARRGKAALKADIAAKTEIDVSHLPYDEDVVSLIRQRRAAGNQVYLASASNERYVRAVADHLGLFDGWFASNDKENLSSQSKARCLVEAFGEDGFDYVGNARADLAVWSVASHRIGVRVSPAVRSKLINMDPDA